MRIIGVIDIMDGFAVHATKGLRSTYKPFEDSVARSSRPLDIARAFESEFGISELYVADIDAIIGKPLQSRVLKELVDLTGMRLMVDAGVCDVERAMKLRDLGVHKIIVGTETLPSESVLQAIIRALDAANVALSIDVKDMYLLAVSKALEKIAPGELVRLAESYGVREFLMISLDRVGTSSGPNWTFVKELKKQTSRPIIVGGGIRSFYDVLRLNSLGIEGVLASTALHTGRLSKNDISFFQSLKN